MNISDKGIALLTELEGFRNHAYKDTGGRDTIGVGHLLNKSERASGKIWIAGKPVKYTGPDYPNDPGACATDLLPVLFNRGFKVAACACCTVVTDDDIGARCVADTFGPNHFARAICQAVVATQPKEQLA